MSSVADGPHAPRGNDQRAMRAAPRNTTKHLGARVPVRRPSGGVAQGDEPHGCGERTRRPRLKGHGRPLYAGPRSDTGGREVWPQARPGCRGALLFGYFLLGKQEKVTRRKGEREFLFSISVWKINLGPAPFLIVICGGLKFDSFGYFI